jgi:hypothetical protein
MRIGGVHSSGSFHSPGYRNAPLGDARRRTRSQDSHGFTAAVISRGSLSRDTRGRKRSSPAVQEAYIQGVSTRAVDNLVRAMGCEVEPILGETYLAGVAFVSRLSRELCMVQSAIVRHLSMRRQLVDMG